MKGPIEMDVDAELDPVTIRGKGQFGEGRATIMTMRIE
jgi:hypothetical protein